MNKYLNSTHRSLPWDACYNARDLGGLPRPRGTAAQPVGARSSVPTFQPAHCHWQTGAPRLWSARDPQSPRATGAPNELSIYTTPSADPAEPTYLNLPLEAYYPHVSALIAKAATRGEVYCIILDHYPDLVATALLQNANARPGGVLIHCRGGKDRTGTYTRSCCVWQRCPTN